MSSGVPRQLPACCHHYIPARKLNWISGNCQFLTRPTASRQYVRLMPLNFLTNLQLRWNRSTRHTWSAAMCKCVDAENEAPFNWTKKLVFEDDSSCVTLQKISASVQMFQFPKTKEETLTLWFVPVHFCRRRLLWKQRGTNSRGQTSQSQADVWGDDEVPARSGFSSVTVIINNQ